MSVKLELTPEVEGALLAEAQARGLSLDEYVKQMILERGRAANAPTFSTEEWEREFDAWVNSFPDAPVLSDEAITRESMYPDRR